LLTETVLAGALESVNPSWTADLDSDPEGMPTAIILSAEGGDRLELVPVAFTGRTLILGSTAIHLASARAGARIVELIAARSGDFFGPVRRRRRPLPPIPLGREAPATPPREPIRAPLERWHDGEPPVQDGFFPPA
jgi:hypothetical protein